MISLRVTEIAVAKDHSSPLSEKRMARNCWPQALFHCHKATELFPLKAPLQRKRGPFGEAVFMSSSTNRRPPALPGRQ